MLPTDNGLVEKTEDRLGGRTKELINIFWATLSKVCRSRDILLET